MKVVHLNSSDTKGGAARAAYRLHSGLRAAGVESGMLVEQKFGSDPAVRVHRSPMNFSARLKRRWRRQIILRDMAAYRTMRPAGFDCFSDDRTRYNGELLGTIGDGSVVNLHWVMGMMDYVEVLPELAERFPLVWTLHDMNPFTGGCHYSSGCERYMSACGKCPQLGSEEEKDLSRAIWKRKQKAFGAIPDERMTIVCPSAWLAGSVAKSSLLSRFPCEVIPNGLPLGAFTRKHKQFSRQILGIPEDARVLLFVADVTDNRRKGLRLLIDALKGRDPKLHLVSVGGAVSVEADGLRSQSLGSITNDTFLSVAYSAADLFICPSLEDNLPNTILESFACGTPAVGFRIGGIPDMIRPGQTGWLAETTDAACLGATIETAFEELATRGEEISRRCRDVVEQEYSLELQGRRYLEIYRRMTKQIE